MTRGYEIHIGSFFRKLTTHYRRPPYTYFKEFKYYKALKEIIQNFSPFKSDQNDQSRDRLETSKQYE